MLTSSATYPASPPWRAHLLRLTVAITTLLMTGLALAGGTWSHTVSHRYSGSTSLKITEPKGFAVEVTVGEEIHKDTIPTIVPLPDADAFVPVLVRAGDGSTWAEKVEVRAKQQTSLVVSHTPATPTTKAKPQRKYAGNVAAMAGSSCGRRWKGREIRFELVEAESGDSGGEVVFSKDDSKSMEVAGGSYDVRVYVKYKGGFSYYDTKRVSLERDGFIIGFGCERGKDRPAVLFK
ncbi:MAG: hypothetical protein R3B72_36200 [Polyangiaceae bacterium]